MKCLGCGVALRLAVPIDESLLEPWVREVEEIEEIVRTDAAQFVGLPVEPKGRKRFRAPPHAIAACPKCGHTMLIGVTGRGLTRKKWNAYNSWYGQTRALCPDGTLSRALVLA